MGQITVPLSLPLSLFVVLLQVWSLSHFIVTMIVYVSEMVLSKIWREVTASVADTLLTQTHTCTVLCSIDGDSGQFVVKQSQVS